MNLGSCRPGIDDHIHIHLVPALDGNQFYDRNGRDARNFGRHSKTRDRLLTFFQSNIFSRRSKMRIIYTIIIVFVVLFLLPFLFKTPP